MLHQKKKIQLLNMIQQKRMNESGFTRYIFKKLPSEVYKLKIRLAQQNGVPDAYFSGPAGDCWVEFKYITAPKRALTSIVPALSRLQTDWLNKRFDEGRTVAVIVGSDIGCYIYDIKDWATPILNVHLKDQDRTDVIKWIVRKTLG